MQYAYALTTSVSYKDAHIDGSVTQILTQICNYRMHGAATLYANVYGGETLNSLGFYQRTKNDCYNRGQVVIFRETVIYVVAHVLVAMRERNGISEHQNFLWSLVGNFRIIRGCNTHLVWMFLIRVQAKEQTGFNA